MKQFKARLLALCALMVLVAAALAPIAAKAQAYGPRGCPDVTIPCGLLGTPRTCKGTRVGSTCQYSFQCLNCQ